MFVVFGETRYSKKLGFVADHCDECAAVRVFRVNRVGLATHIFWLPVSAGRLQGFTRVCQTCKTEFHAEPTDYRQLSRRKAAAIDLTRDTNPKLMPENRTDIEAHRRLVELRRPILEASDTLQARYAKGTHLDLAAGLSFLATFAIPLLLVLPEYDFLSVEGRERIGTAAAFIFTFGLIASFIVLFREPRRYFRKHVESRLVAALAPLNPSSHELNELLQKLKKYGHRICDFVKANDLMEKIAQPVTREAFTIR